MLLGSVFPRCHCDKVACVQPISAAIASSVLPLASMAYAIRPVAVLRSGKLSIRGSYNAGGKRPCVANVSQLTLDAMDFLHPDSQVIDQMGGPTAIARVCKIRSQAVSQWRRNGIPSARRQFLELLRPEVFSGAKADSSGVRANGDEGRRDAA